MSSTPPPPPIPDISLTLIDLTQMLSHKLTALRYEIKHLADAVECLDIGLRECAAAASRSEDESSKLAANKNSGA